MLKIAGLDACDPWCEEAWDPCLEGGALLTGTIALVGVRSLLEDQDDSIAMFVALAVIAGAELLEVRLRSESGSVILFSHSRSSRYWVCSRSDQRCLLRPSQ